MREASANRINIVRDLNGRLENFDVYGPISSMADCLDRLRRGGCATPARP